MAKKSEKSQTSQAQDEHEIIVTPHLVVVALNEKQQKQARECIRTSGKAAFSMKEISVTSLPETLTHQGLIIID